MYRMIRRSQGLPITNSTVLSKALALILVISTKTITFNRPQTTQDHQWQQYLIPNAIVSLPQELQIPWFPNN